MKRVNFNSEFMKKIHSAQHASRPYTVDEHRGKICLKVKGQQMVLLDTEDRFQLIIIVNQLEDIGYDNITTSALKILTEAVEEELSFYDE